MSSNQRVATLLVSLFITLLLGILFRKKRIPQRESLFTSFRFSYLLVGLFLYIGSSFFLGFFFAYLFAEASYGVLKMQIAYLSLLFAIMVFFFLSLPKEMQKALIPYKEWKKDLLVSAALFLIALPAVVFIWQSTEWIAVLLSKKELSADQLAIALLKEAMQVPWIFTLFVILIALIVPMIEEFLFRGLLQSYLRQKIGSSFAVILTSVVFAAIHYSSIQGWTNLPLLSSLFVLSLFIGWGFERRKSLITAISIHILFNIFGILNCIYIQREF